MMRRLTALLLCMVLLSAGLTGCTSAKATDLMTGVQPGDRKTSIDVTGPEAAAVTDFAVRLLQNLPSGEENTLLSPLSVLCALAMTENGAKGETLSQMETVFGLDLATLNHYLYAYTKSLPQGDKYQLSLANSIWLRDDAHLTVEPAFLQTNADWYGAGAFKAPFDHSTCKEINRWVEDHTNGMIDGVLDKIPAEAMLYLINALAFEAEWQSVYETTQVWQDTFTAQDGTERTVDFLHSKEYRYLSDDKASGFIKYYADNQYAFAALLPDEGVSVSDYVAGFTGEKLHDLLLNCTAEPVYTSIPKFETEYAASLAETLQSMGLTDAFDSAKADFTAMGRSENGPLFINDVIHKTYIKVDEKGTKAGAVTAVEMNVESAAPIEDPKEVNLNRPFIYMIVDTEANLPIFLGTMLDIA